jgi:hypothetical protein
MPTDQEKTSAPDSGNAKPVQQQQQPQPVGNGGGDGNDGHGGQGADSVMQQMRAWEQRRASNAGRRSNSR